MTASRFHEVIEVAGRRIGPGQPCFVIAEVGINHNGDMDLARREIDAAVESGADAVKFQNYRVEDFLSDRSLTFTYTSQGRQVTEPQYDMFKRYELSVEQLALLKNHCDQRGVIFQSTPMSRQGIQDLIAIGAPFLKNGSDALSNLDLVRAMGETGLPTIMSTGMATLAEIDEAVRAFAGTGNRDLLLLHCTSSYPTPAEETNLARIVSLARVFGCPAGFSDHTQGTLAAALSVAFGACLVEKHFTFDHDLPGPDHWFSVTPAELAELVKSIRRAETMTGSAELGPTKSEEQGRQEYRLSCVAAEALSEGRRLTADDIAFRRPGHGVAPAQAYLLGGRVLRRAVPKGHVFAAEDFA
jgi:N-acetylneuraminate synthase/N,N'-diacetyllegionaminate synthase